MEETIVQPKEITEKEADKFLNAIFLASKEDNNIDNKYFLQAVDSISIMAIDEYSKKINLSQTEKEEIIASYNNEKTTIIDKVHNKITNKKRFNQENEITYEHLNSLNGFSESIANLLCILPDFIPASRVGKIALLSENALSVATTPTCENILAEIMSPMTDLLREKAMIKDMEIIISTLQMSDQSIHLKTSDHTRYHYF